MSKSVVSKIFQGAFILITISIIVFFYNNVQSNLDRQNIASGFGFLNLEAGFEIGEGLLSYQSDESYMKALLVGISNTLKVALVGNFLAIILGVVVGVSRLSSNWLVSKLSYGYIEVVRNIPLLLQLFFWYSLFTDVFPNVRQAINLLPGVFLSNRGLVFPIPENMAALVWIGLSFVVSVILSFIFFKTKDRDPSILKYFLLLPLIIPVLVWLGFGAPYAMNIPELKGFNFRGGYTLSPEFASLLLGLVIYTSAFIAEIVRSGILAIKKGQWEASYSLGLNNFQTLFLIILPQSLRVIIPPLTSQVLNLTKNSSLAVAIAYPDFVSVANTTMNQTGQAIEIVFLIMCVYLFFSLTTSLLMNLYNKRIALTER